LIAEPSYECHEVNTGLKADKSIRKRLIVELWDRLLSTKPVSVNAIHKTLAELQLTVNSKDWSKIFLAGAFGYFINVEHAMRIGLLPRIDQTKVGKIDNAAVEGARQALVSKTKRSDAETVAKRIEHVKLEEEEDFLEKLIKGI
jgi:uncharacterized 2Fe-2S/4Fe-4S cluster protein (DUF4445 family)